MQEATLFRLFFSLAAVLSAFPSLCEAATFTETPNITITGKIEKGDLKRFMDFVVGEHDEQRFSHFMTDTIYLNSPGGDVREALRFAALFEATLAKTGIRKGDSCASACFLIWSTGVQRVNSGRIGVHRISLVAPSVDIRATSAAIAPTAVDIEALLVRSGIPRRVIDKMNETAPSSVFWIDNAWIYQEGIEEALENKASYIDVVEKRCGVSPETETARTHAHYTSKAQEAWRICEDKVRKANQRGSSLEKALIEALE